MGYRKLPRPEPKPRRTLQDTSTGLHIYVQNGCSSTFSIPCWYSEVRKPRPAEPHCRDWHDHVGWPEPRHVDHSCQSWDFAHDCCGFGGDPHRRGHHRDHCVDLGRMLPIHLLKEGYGSVDILRDYEQKQSDDKLELIGWIREDADWVVDIHTSVSLDDAIDKDVVIPITVVIQRPVKYVSESHAREYDLLTKGFVHVQRGPLKK